MPSTTGSSIQFQPRHTQLTQGSEDYDIPTAQPGEAPKNYQVEVAPLSSQNLSSADATMAWRNPKSMSTLPQPLSKQTFSSWRDFSNQ